MRSSRLLAILILLQLRVRLTAEALAAEFEVSVRTIYRDIDALSAAGVPVYGDRGPGGGFQLLEGYQTRLTGLASDEAEAMLMIGLPGPAAALGLGPAAARARGKLLASLPRSWSEDAGRIGARFHLDPVDWYRRAEPIGHLPALTRAVLDAQQLVIQYESWTSTRSWIIDPLGLVLKAGNWYVVARTAGELRTFKITAIKSLENCGVHFDRPTEFNLASHWSESIARFETELRKEVADVRLTALGARQVRLFGAYAAEAVEAAGGSDADGTICIHLPIESIDSAARLLLGLGPEFEVVAPVQLRLRVAELAEHIAATARSNIHMAT